MLLRNTIPFLILISFSIGVRAQKIEHIFFNLYTDSLKKGAYNYINVDAKFADGTWLPLTNKELTFTSTAGKFSGNSLFIDSGIKDEKVTIRATLSKKPSVYKEIDIYIKKYESQEKLKTLEEILNQSERKSIDKRRRKR